MGLGDDLLLTALFREVKERHPERKLVYTKRRGIPVTPREILWGRPVRSSIFLNNPHLSPIREVGLLERPICLHEGDERLKYWTYIDKERIVFKTGGNIIDILCRGFGIENPRKKCVLVPTPDELAAASRVAAEIGRPFVLIEPHAKDTATANKGYPFPFWQAVADAVRGLGVEAVQVGTGGKPVLDGVRSVAGRLTFRETAALMPHSLTLVATEGGLMHAANAMGLPAVIVYTGYNRPWFAGYPENVSIFSDFECAPCGLQKPCPKSMRCRDRITPSMVIDGVTRLLDEKQRRTA